jgi:hypothetical protein
MGDRKRTQRRSAKASPIRWSARPTSGTKVKRDPRDEPVKLADHAMDATRYALHGELGEAARTEAYLAAMQRRLGEMQLN